MREKEVNNGSDTTQEIPNSMKHNVYIVLHVLETLKDHSIHNQFKVDNHDGHLYLRFKS